ncbi:SNARE domain-containing protein [Apiospora phragmitis]|uniref:SNARE domain-containing protein n=1 Tax=Apiospora phragmitis TaxID=2905665 RepID=A0ABR1WST0_9PEZI
MPSANQLFLLADHIKLSLLERKRAQSLDIDAGSKDGAISQSLDQFRDGLTALDQEQKRLEEAGDEEGALTIGDNLPGLKQQYDDLTAQFHGFSSTSSQSTLTHPNDPTLASDFDHATTLPASGGASRPKAGQRTASKTVRFSDNPPAAQSSSDPELEAQLFGGRRSRYRDEPDGGEGYRDEADDMSNTQIHAYHQQIMDQQDQQLDALGTSIARQRELSMQIGDELDDQVAMLDDVDEAVDRHQGRIDRARGQVGRITRSASDNKQLMAIIILIIVLILLIALLK